MHTKRKLKTWGRDTFVTYEFNLRLLTLISFLYLKTFILTFYDKV